MHAVVIGQSGFCGSHLNRLNQSDACLSSLIGQCITDSTKQSENENVDGKVATVINRKVDPCILIRYVEKKEYIFEKSTGYVRYGHEQHSETKV